MPALELLTGRVTAPGTTLTKVTMNTGNSSTIRNAPLDAKTYLVNVFAYNNAAGILRIRSPKLHDNVQGIRLKVNAADVKPLLPLEVLNPVYPQDDLTIELSGSATAGHIELVGLLIYYSNIPGITARFIGIDDLKKRMKNIFTVENSLTLGTTGDYSGEEAINSEYDLFKANTDYALLGYIVDSRCLAIRWKGADTGNLGIGGPGEPALREVTKQWFVYLTKNTGINLIPVFNSANKAAILIDGVTNQAGGTVVVNSIFAELA